MAAAVNTASADMTFAWGNTMPCVATYRILEGDRFLDQFEDVDIPFEEAGEVKMSSLRYFPRTTTNSAIIELLALEMSQRFLTLVQKTFTIKPHKTGDTAANIIRDVAAVFGNRDKLISDLAEAVAARIDFPAA